MFFVRPFRLAASCAVVALSCLPCVSNAQARVKSADTPFFANDLTRDTLGNISHLNEKVTSDARMTPGPNSHMVVMGKETTVWCQPGKFIELAPNYNIAGFKAVSVAVFEDGVRTQASGLDQDFILRIDPPSRGGNRKRVQVIAYDAQARAQLVMTCTVRSTIADPTIAALDYKEGKERCGFEIKDRQKYTSSCLYLGDMYLGSVEANAGKIDVDERLLPPGSYTVQMVGKNTDDILVPGSSTEFSVPNRYKIACENDAKEIVIGEHDDETVKVTVTHTPGLSIKKTRVYIAGKKAGEAAGDEFTMKLPVAKVPEGNCFIEVIGVGEDGVEYPVESLPVTIKNDAWKQRLLHTDEYQRISENKAKIDKLWQDVCTNLERAKYEHDIYKDSTTFTLTSITEHYTVGKSAEYQAAAKTAFIAMSQLQLQNARLYRKLDMLSIASSMYSRVWRELGSDNPDGEDAMKELSALRKAADNAS